jgi:hypothetical protein
MLNNNESAPTPVRGQGRGKEQEDQQTSSTFNAPSGQQWGAVEGSPFSITAITAIIPGRLSKQFELGENGEIDKKSGGQLVEGVCHHLIIQDMEDFARRLPLLQINTALAYGVPSGLAPDGKVKVMTKKAVGKGQIARTRDYFAWTRGPGILMIDYDPRDGLDPLVRGVLRQTLISICPSLEGAPMVMADSASSWIYDRSDEKCSLRIGQRGLRAYILVRDSWDIPRAGKVLFDRLWLAGRGYFRVSKSGQRLPRTIIDGAVFQPERLDFAAGASCLDPLKQKRPDPEVFNNDAPPLNTMEAIPNLTHAEKCSLGVITAAAREEVAEEARAVREKWAAERLEEYKERQREKGEGLDEAAEEDVLKAFRLAVEDQKLPSYFELILEGGERVTVSDLLRDPDRYHGQRCADPLEPDYDNDDRIGCINLRSGGRPHVWSHAHGGQRYELLPEKVLIQLVGGEGARAVVTMDKVIGRSGDIFQVAGELVRVVETKTIAIKPEWLQNRADELIRFERYSVSAEKYVTKDCPRELALKLLANRGAWSAPVLNNIILAPVMRPDGSPLDRAGYDKDTGILFLASQPGEMPSILHRPGRDQVRAALATAWEPFAHFPLKTPLDRAIALAAMITAIQRPMLLTAPAFAFDAPTAGSGKTKAAQAVGMFGGSLPAVSPWPSQKEEQRKSIFAHLLSLPQSLLLDNIDGPVESADLCALLTSPNGFEDRVLGKSERVTVPSRVLVLMTGNNIQPVGDISRRLLKITMDHGVERPDALQFPFDPVALMRKRWREYRVALLTVLRGFIEAGAPRHGQSSMGSFEEWDRLVRQCVCWLAHESLAPFELADPAEGVNVNYAQDTDTAKLRALLHAWRGCFDDAHTAVKGAIAYVEHGFLPVGDEGEERPDAQAKRELLKGVLEEIAGEGRSGINPRRLGQWIKKRAGRIVNGLRFERGTMRDGNARWFVQDCNS